MIRWTDSEAPRAALRGSEMAATEVNGKTQGGRWTAGLGAAAVALFFLAALLAAAPALSGGPNRWLAVGLLAAMGALGLLALPTLRRRAVTASATTPDF